MMNPNFDKQNGLIPAIVQDAASGVVLMLGYMNQEAIDQTRSTKQVTFFSRSKNRLWVKGETSGNFLNLVSMHLDCDQDTLLVKAHPVGPACHTGDPTCFHDQGPEGLLFLGELEKVIENRAKQPKAGSYTSDLLARGINKVAQKVGEEAVELVIEAKDNDQGLFLGEAADLLYHYLILLRAKGASLNDVVEVLQKRHRK